MPGDEIETSANADVSVDVTSPSSSETANLDVTSPSSSESEGVDALTAAVDAALGQKSEAAPASDEPGSNEPGPDSPEKGEISEEEIANYSKRVQSRIHELLDAKKSVEAEKVQYQQELETIKPKAAQLDHLLGYMREHEIQPEHLDNALGLVALINKGDYQKALPMLEGIMQQVRSMAGEVLPPELAERTRLGYIPEADAKELHKARLAQQRMAEQVEQTRREAESQRQQQVVASAITAADAWNAEQAQSDPDWNQKRSFVEQRMEVELSRRLREQGPAGYPRTQKDVRDLLNTAKSEVEKELKKFRPAPRPIDPPVSGIGASPRSQAKPQSLDDYVNQALAKATG